MAYDLEEQEQLDTFKAWWKQYGNLISWVVIIALVGYAAWTAWNTYQRNQSSQASQLYEELLKSADAKDNVKAQRAASDLEAKFGSTAYAQMAALVAAKSASDAGDIKVAKEQLRWAIDHGDVTEYKSLAKIRLAGIALDEKSYDQGLALLNGEFDAQLAAEVADRKADILVAQNKLAEARESYQLALDKSDRKNPARELIELKLSAVGGSANTVVSK
jgi:predicted negative regulator of RcsB-dependent stress response